MIDYKVYSPSYKRSDVAITHKVFENNFCYVVREEEEAAYRKLDVELLIIPRGKVSNIANTRNWILDNTPERCIVTVDDDMAGIYRNVKRNPVKLSSEEVHGYIENFFVMSEDVGCGIFGINTDTDPLSYSINLPFYLSQVVLGPFTGILDKSIRYDESLPLKEDYDFFLQQIMKHRKVLRCNFLAYKVDHFKMKGGCQTYRTKEDELKQNEALIAKWGSDIIKSNHLSKSTNMIVKTGL